MNKKYLAHVGALLALGSFSSAYGAGFQLLEQSAAGLGRAFAGGSLAADDASAAFYNPADMLLIKEGNVLQLGATYIAVENHFKGTYSSTLPPTAVAVDENATTESVVPHLHYVHSINDRHAVGLAITAPFGLSTEYNDSWAAKYMTVSSEIITTDINPSYAYKVADELLIGAGLSAQHVEVNLEQSALGSFFGSPTDATAKVNGDDWSWGYNVGLTWLPNKEQRVSLTYRSEVEYELEGEIKVTGFTAPAAFYNTVDDGGGDITLPETVTFNVWQKVDDRMAAMFSVRHTRWSRYEVLKITFPDNPVWNSTEVQNWHDTLSASFGVEYKRSDTIILRSGFGYDESPISSSIYRSARLPAADNLWLSIGCGWQITEQLSLDAAYMYVKSRNSSANYTNTSGSTLKGKFDHTHAQEIGLQLVYRF